MRWEFVDECGSWCILWYDGSEYIWLEALSSHKRILKNVIANGLKRSAQPKVHILIQTHSTNIYNENTLKNEVWW